LADKQYRMYEIMMWCSIHGCISCLRWWRGRFIFYRNNEFWSSPRAK